MILIFIIRVMHVYSILCAFAQYYAYERKMPVMFSCISLTIHRIQNFPDQFQNSLNFSWSWFSPALWANLHFESVVLEFSAKFDTISIFTLFNYVVTDNNYDSLIVNQSNIQSNVITMCILEVRCRFSLVGASPRAPARACNVCSQCQWNIIMNLFHITALASCIPGVAYSQTTDTFGNVLYTTSQIWTCLADSAPVRLRTGKLRCNFIFNCSPPLLSVCSNIIQQAKVIINFFHCCYELSTFRTTSLHFWSERTSFR